jgi:hypothetical protein
MEKLAIFVEGQTELRFIERFLQEIAGMQNITIKLERKWGSGIVALKGRSLNLGGERYFALIYDCQGDNAVRSAIADRMSDLKAKGYKTILGVRDLHPLDLSELDKLIKGLHKDLKLDGMSIKIVVAVREIEAWFLKEEKHFCRIGKSLTPDFIKKEFGFDPIGDPVEKPKHPADLLDSIYKIANKRYKKRDDHVQRTVACLDYENLYEGVAAQVESLRIFVECIDQFLDSA